MACAFGGVAIPPSRLRPILVNMKVYWLSRAHSSESLRRSNSSPSGSPQPARKTSWIEGECGDGKASYATLV